MSENIKISTLNESTDVEALESIFFATAAIQNFSTMDARNLFKHKYFGIYLEKFPELFLVAQDDSQVLGYCIGSPHTGSDFYVLQPHLKIFEDLYNLYPAHLHINLHPHSQGKGVGSLLLSHWEDLIRPSLKGYHIMTSPEARNRKFYQRAGLVNEFSRPYKGHDILLMGKTF